jgi:hypothetical protein
MGAHASRPSARIRATMTGSELLSPAGGWRVYRWTGIPTRMLVIGGWFEAIGLFAVLGETIQPGGPSALGLILFGLFLVGNPAMFRWTARRTVVSETSAGLVSWANFRRSRIAWEDIEAFVVFDNQPLGPPPVIVKRRKGWNVMLPLMQGKRVAWQGGETTDIVSVLAERLNEVRAMRDLAPLENAEELPARWAGSRSRPP